MQRGTKLHKNEIKETVKGFRKVIISGWKRRGIEEGMTNNR